ncbi:penicillin-binding protein 1A [Parvularcula dongshanensis]|uniref:Penicillin-binding protein 1A n=1 Tax=Parvularcula dongshanensis TaxID=1173995 RepID=A0A840I799_9PROT|nr:penicillin-binding protein 1A [Parvularcula dongshanensis]MBB4659850.1 penicillin-binding protein 1A [Parvularcula dongshanensis]
MTITDSRRRAYDEPEEDLFAAEPLYDEPQRAPRKKKSKLRLALRIFGVLCILGVIAAVGAGFYAWSYISKLDVPDYEVLADYEPAVTTRVHGGDGSLVAEFARERRLFVPAEAIPDVVKQAFMSAEDKNFYEHSGIDPLAFVKSNLPRVIQGQRVVGASTITQQVAKVFLLTSDRKIERKVKEALIARRMERAFTKDQILELYLNEIYLGNRSYGVAAGALNYFDKPLDELNPAEAAYLATLPKAPSNYHPVRQADRAIARRNWILGQMGENGYLSEAEVEEYQAAPLGAHISPPLGARSSDSEYFAEDVRRRIASRYGVEALYDEGLSIRATLDPRLQDAAQRALRAGLEDYDRRHGWRGPLTTIDLPANLGEHAEQTGEEQPPFVWQQALNEARSDLYENWKASDDLAPWEVGVVLEAGRDAARIGLPDGRTGTLPLSDLTRCESCPDEGDHWAREYAGPNARGPMLTAVTDVLSEGDVVYVLPTETAGKVTLSLRQVPGVNGGIVAIDPHTGRVLAMVGGYSFGLSEFNRATQAWRQPGSTFKPFVYAAALEAGYTPSSIVLDAPFVAPGLNGEWWKPGNYVAGRFYGESTLRLGIEKSRNTMTARLAQDLGIGRIIDVAERFGVSDQLPRELAISLGAGETTLMRLTTAYAQFVNGGKAIDPVLIDRVQDRYGHTVYARDERHCEACNVEEWDDQPEPLLADDRKQVIDPRTAYQMVSIMEGVIDRGTGTRVNNYVDRNVPLAGKTGTTDDYRDAWFVGFSPDLAVGIYVGFDTPATMGEGEGGGIVSAPIFGRFMADALEGETVVPFRAPSGIRLVRVNARTGRPAQPGETNVILEAFKAEDDIYGDRRFDSGASLADQGRGDESITDDLGGIY